MIRKVYYCTVTKIISFKAISKVYIFEDKINL